MAAVGGWSTEWSMLAVYNSRLWQIYFLNTSIKGADRWHNPCSDVMYSNPVLLFSPSLLSHKVIPRPQTSEAILNNWLRQTATKLLPAPVPQSSKVL